MCTAQQHNSTSNVVDATHLPLLTAWRLNRHNFGFADKSRAELQDLVPQPEPKKQRIEVTVPRTRSQGKEQPEQPEEQRRREEEEAVEAWRKISEEHHREKEAEERRKAKEQKKGKAKVHEEDVFQDMPEIEVPHQMPDAPMFDTTRLTSLLLASTLMQTMKA